MNFSNKFHSVINLHPCYQKYFESFLFFLEPLPKYQKSSTDHVLRVSNTEVNLLRSLFEFKGRAELCDKAEISAMLKFHKSNMTRLSGSVQLVWFY